MIDRKSTDPPQARVGIVSGYDLDLEQDRPDAPSPAPGQTSSARPSLARDFALLALAMLALLALVALGGQLLGSAVTP